MEIIKVQLCVFAVLNLFLDIMILKTAKGLALQDILAEVHPYVHRSMSCPSYLAFWWLFCYAIPINFFTTNLESTCPNIVLLLIGYVHDCLQGSLSILELKYVLEMYWGFKSVLECTWIKEMDWNFYCSFGSAIVKCNLKWWITR